MSTKTPPWLLSTNILLAALSKSNRLAAAHRLFDRMPERDTVTFNTLISTHARLGLTPSALLLFRRLLLSDLRPDPHSLLPLVPLLDPHSLLPLALKTSLLSDPLLASSLHSATLLSASSPSAALSLFALLHSDQAPLNPFTLPSVLAAAAALRDLRAGAQLHSLALRSGLAADRYVNSSLLTLYANCSHFSAAAELLLHSDDPVSWNSLIVIHSRSGRFADALHLFVEMLQRNLKPDDFTFPSVLNAAAASAALARTGTSIHSLVLKSGFESHLHVANALIDMYAKHGNLTSARGVFHRALNRDVVSWTALLTGLSRHVSEDAALQLYVEMRATTTVFPDEFVLAGVLSACAGLTLLELGRQAHSLAVRTRFDAFRSVGNSLVSMYAKCGCIGDAQRAFDSMCARDPITWTALIVGYARNGKGKHSLALYDKMVRTGFEPDYVTFIGLLFACSHAGLVDAGRTHFESMESVYNITAGPEHYACMIDLLGRSGRVDEAVELLDRMRTEPDSTVWKALLAACRVHRNVGLAEWAAENLIKLEPHDAVPYVLLSNIYSSIGRWDDVARIRSLMRSNGASKEPGCSWIEAGSVVHVFHSEDRGHPRAVEIYAKVDEMMSRIRSVGYVADTGFVLHDVAEEGKEEGLAYHSEKLAVAFGLIGVPRGTAIRVYKNLRVCGDCHNALKLVSRVYGREIVLRDSNCFHHFSEGVCSCGDYW